MGNTIQSSLWGSCRRPPKNPQINSGVSAPQQEEDLELGEVANTVHSFEEPRLFAASNEEQLQENPALGVVRANLDEEIPSETRKISDSGSNKESPLSSKNNSPKKQKLENENLASTEVHNKNCSPWGVLAGTVVLATMGVVTYFFIDKIKNDSHQTIISNNSQYATSEIYIDLDTQLLAYALGSVLEVFIDLFSENKVIDFYKKNKHLLIPVEYIIPNIIPPSLGQPRIVRLYSHAWKAGRAGGFLVDSIKNNGQLFYKIWVSSSRNLSNFFSRIRSSISESLKKQPALIQDVILSQEEKYGYFSWIGAGITIGIASIVLQYELADDIVDSQTRENTTSLLNSVWTMLAGSLFLQTLGVLYHDNFSNHAHRITKIMYWLFPSLCNPIQDTSGVTAGLLSCRLIVGGAFIGWYPIHLAKESKINHKDRFNEIQELKLLANHYPEEFKSIYKHLLAYWNIENKGLRKSSEAKITRALKICLRTLAIIISIASPFVLPIEKAANKISAGIAFLLTDILVQKYKQSPFHNEKVTVINDLLNRNLLPLILGWCLTTGEIFTPETELSSASLPFQSIINCVANAFWAAIAANFYAEEIEGKLKHSTSTLEGKLKEMAESLDEQYKLISLGKKNLEILQKIIKKEDDTISLCLTLSQAIYLYANIGKHIGIEQLEHLIAEVDNRHQYELRNQSSKISFKISEECSQSSYSVRAQTVISTMAISPVIAQTSIQLINFKLGF